MGKTSCTAIVTAAGAGKRFGGKTPKQFLMLNARPVLAWAIQIFQEIEWIDEIVVVAPEESLDYVAQEIVERYRLDKVRRVIAGSSRRQDSVYRGLQAVSPESEMVAIHDGVRPFCRRSIVNELFQQAIRTGAAIPGFPLRETIKEVQDFRVVKTRNRQRFWQVQTPQIFRRSLLESAFGQANKAGFSATDDAGLIERIKHPVHLVLGDSYNIKITTLPDLEVARRLFSIYFSDAGKWIA